MHEKTSLYVQFGCGLCAPDGWLNFDSSPTLRIQKIPLVGLALTTGRPKFPKNARYGDIVRGLPVAGNSCKAVFSSHVLEHLSYNEFFLAMRETYRILEDGGIFRLVVPDLRAIAERYIDRVSRGETDASSKFFEEAHLGVASRPKTIIGRLAAAYGNSAHLWMWDELSIKDALDRVGFRSHRRAFFRDNSDPMFSLVEDQERFSNAIAMEATK